MLAGRRDRGHPDPPALGVELAEGGGLGLVEQPQELAGVPGEDPARRHELEAAALAGDDGDGQLALQGGDRGGYRGLADEQRLGRRSYRSGGRHGHERPQT